MLAIDRFKNINPQIDYIKVVRNKYEEVIGWQLFDEGGAVLGYGFSLKVPEQDLDIPLAEEFDAYMVTGIVSTDYVLKDLVIEIHEDYDNPVWAEDILEAEYINQYIGLTADSIKLSPDGEIDAISESTISSAAVTDSVRKKMEAFQDCFK